MSKDSMSSLDINIALETLSLAAGSFIDNIYSLEDEIFLFRLRGVNHSLWKNPFLLIEPGKRIHFTKFKRSMPENPSNKLTALRTHVKNLKITSIRQHGFDRVLIIDLSGEQEASLFVELFGRGNLILVENQRVIFSLWYRKMRDRDLLPGKPFEFPPARGSSLLEATNDDLLKSIETERKEKGNEQLVKTLVRNFGASGQLVEEVLHTAGIEKRMPISDFTQEYAGKITASLAAIKSKMYQGPAGIVEKDGLPIAAVPFPFETLNGELVEKKDFNEALDDYFSPIELLKSKEVEIHANKLQQLEKILEQQLSHLQKLEEQANNYKMKGDILFLHLHLVQELFDTIISARKKGIEWEEISNKLELGKQKKLPAAMILKELAPNRKAAIIELEGIELEADFTLKPADIANSFYEAGKKAEGKLAPAREAINSTQLKIEEVEHLREEAVRKAKKMYKKRERRWYEQYHWVKTVNGFLVIGGRDMKSNDGLIRRRMTNDSLFFHADIQGAPYVLLMPDPDVKGTEQPVEEDIKEAALLAAAYSRAWKAGLGSADVYYVNPDQVSYTAPSGEYIPKGGIIIRGKRNSLKNIVLEVTIGLIVTEDYAMVIGGSLDNVKRQTDHYITIKPTESIKKGTIAKRLKAEFTEMMPEEKRDLVERMDINELVAFIP